MRLSHKHRKILADPTLPRADFGPIREALGDLTPDLMPGKRGRHRLVQALTQRFGENFRTNAGAQKLMQHFDDETEHMKAHLKIRLGRG